MKSVLIGNGVVIKFGGAQYLSAAIIQRALDNVSSGNFPSHLYPKECADFVVALQKEHARALRGDYDNYVFTSYDRSSLEDFKKRYAQKHDSSYVAPDSDKLIVFKQALSTGPRTKKELKKSGRR